MIVNKNDNLEFKKIYFNLQCIFAFHMDCHKYIFFTFFSYDKCIFYIFKSKFEANVPFTLIVL